LLCFERAENHYTEYNRTWHAGLVYIYIKRDFCTFFIAFLHSRCCQHGTQAIVVRRFSPRQITRMSGQLKYKETDARPWGANFDGQLC
jgi:hypothetical protein